MKLRNKKIGQKILFSPLYPTLNGP